MPGVTPRAIAASLIAALAFAAGAAGVAQEPRFRGGANLVRLDVYVSANGEAVTDLTADDFEVLEDNAPQVVSSFEFVPARAAGAQTPPVESNTVGEMRARAAEADARAFVLFLDTLHVQVEGSYRAANPVATMLDRVIGPDDLLGVMTPEMAPRNMTFSPRTEPVGDMLRTGWNWGQRGAAQPADSREADLRQCYPDSGPSAGIAAAVIARRREQTVLRVLGDLVDHLEGLRDERTFVLVLSEGWTLPRADERLAAPLGNAAPPGRPDPLGVVDGTLTAGGPGASPMARCERERSLVALSDLAMEFERLVQRANRANVSFYPIDPRGLVVFDEPIGPGRPASPAVDRARLAARQEAMRALADQTDGTAVLDANIEQALPRLLTDVGSYYLLGYVSTNAKLDGRYRRLTVRVHRPGTVIRARPGYLAPSAADLAAAQAERTGSRASAAPSSVGDALSRLPVGRRPAAVHLHAAGAPGRLAVTVEVDRSAAAQPEWADGGRVVVAVEPADGVSGSRSAVSAVLPSGTRVQRLDVPGDDEPRLAAGRYRVRVEALAEDGRAPVVVSIIADVPGSGGLLGSALLMSRRGPATARAFVATADARFRRTERLRAEVALIDRAAVVSGRLLNRQGQPMRVPVTTSERPGRDGQLPAVVAEVTLAPLAAGEYVLEVTAVKGDRTERRDYAIRLVP